MGRRNETNRKAHKKKVDDKKRKNDRSKNALKVKRKSIMDSFNTNSKE